MSSQYSKGWEVLRNFLSHCNIGKEHELFNHVMSINMLVLGDIRGILTIVVQLEFHFGGGESESTSLVSFVTEYSGDFKKATKRLS